MDELEDVGVPANSFDLFLGNFRRGLDRAEKDVEADSSSVQRRFLRYQRHLLAIILHVEFGNLFAIELEVGR